MEKPKFLPQQWVAFTYDEAEDGAFGQIIGGTYSDGKWAYYVSGYEKPVYVTEDQIRLVSRETSWHKLSTDRPDEFGVLL